MLKVDFENPNLKMLLDMLSSGGFPENMSKLSYFPSGVVDQNKKDLCSDIDVAEMLTFSSELESMNLYVVRADDPFLDRNTMLESVIQAKEEAVIQLRPRLLKLIILGRKQSHAPLHRHTSSS